MLYSPSDILRKTTAIGGIMYVSKLTTCRLPAVALAIILWGFGSMSLQAKDRNHNNGCGCAPPKPAPCGCPAPVIHRAVVEPPPCCPMPVVRQRPCGPAPTSCCPVDPKDISRAERAALRAQHEAAEAC